MNTKNYKTLGQILREGLPNDPNWCIYSFGTAFDAPARVGRTRIYEDEPNGMAHVINCMKLSNAKDAWRQSNARKEGITLLDYMVEEGWIEYNDPDRYQIDPGCPRCGSPMYNEEVKEGDPFFTCLMCDHEAEWDSQSSSWK